MLTTRFNPACNGALHLGHVYMILANEAYAHRAGGRFLVRFDDSHPLRIANMGLDRIIRIREQQRLDIEWLGVQVDGYSNQLDRVEGVREWIAQNHNTTMLPGLEVRPVTAMLVAQNFLNVFPMCPQLTVEKTVMDSQDGVTHLIRGIDLLSEYSLYTYFCRCFNLSEPHHMYLPRLNWESGDMSKTSGAGRRTNTSEIPMSIVSAEPPT